MRWWGLCPVQLQPFPPFRSLNYEPHHNSQAASFDHHHYPVSTRHQHPLIQISKLNYKWCNPHISDTPHHHYHHRQHPAGASFTVTVARAWRSAVVIITAQSRASHHTTCTASSLAFFFFFSFFPLWGKVIMRRVGECCHLWVGPAYMIKIPAPSVHSGDISAVYHLSLSLSPFAPPRYLLFTIPR